MGEALDRLPPPVARYLRMALPAGAPPIERATLQQTGRLRPGVRSRRWLPFTATQTATPTACGFLWDARVALLPLVHLRVVDALVDGQGEGRVRLLSVIPLATARGTPELASGALHRYLAEAVWWPAALRPSPHLAWQAIDERRALATLSVRATRVALEFRFNAAGEVVGIYTPSRWGLFGGRFEQRGWEGHFGRYTTQDGMRIPLEGEVGWYAEGVWQPVWVGSIRHAAYLPQR